MLYITKALGYYQVLWYYRVPIGITRCTTNVIYTTVYSIYGMALAHGTVYSVQCTVYSVQCSYSI